MPEIYLAGGCFWGTEKYLSSIRGVLSTQVGYANGKTESPSYAEVCHQNTGYAEAARVVYDSEVIPLAFLLELFYESIDPVSVNRQGGDHGTQYRTGIYYIDGKDLQVIQRSIAQLQNQYCKPIAIEVEPLRNFCPAEEYHQRYLDKHPDGYCHISKAKFEKVAKSIVNPAAYRASDADALRRTLTAVQYEVTQKSATEPPFHNEFWNTFQSGFMWISQPVSHFLPQVTNLNPAAVGPAFQNRLIRM